MTDKPISFAERRAALAAERGVKVDQPSKRTPIAPEPKFEFPDELIPDVLGERTEDDINVDAIIESIDVLDAYRRWIGKEVDEKTTGQTEGIKVSCPFPNHRDSRPSAWLNRDKKAFHCGGCEEGGDLYDMAAIHFDYPRPEYKQGKMFHDLRRQMAESYGYRFKTVAGTEVVWREEEAEPVRPTDSVDREGAGSDSPAAPEGDHSGDVPEVPAVKTSKVTVLHEADVEDSAEEEIEYPVLDWKAIVPKGTFLWEFMQATSVDDSPEEYHFWHGLLALGHAVGRNAFLNDTRPVYGNLLVCLLGGTGFGKSRARAWLDDVLEEVLPYRDNGLDTSGVRICPVPASGENLISQFQHIANDPSLPKGIADVRTPINGIVDYDEFAGLLARAGRPGATLKQIIMGFSDSKTRVNSSSNTGGTFEAYKPFCSITATTQPKAVRPLLSRTDTTSGFLNRWLFVGGPRKKREVMGGVHSSIRVDLTSACDELKKIRGWGAAERDIRFTDKGLKEYERFIRRAVFPIQETDDTDLLTRLDLTMKRLVLLFCVNERTTEVTEHIVKRCEPILNYLVQCYGILNAEIGVTQMTEITGEILRHIQRIEEKTGRGASARDLGQRMKRKNYSPDLIKKALETMVSLDWIDIDKTTGPGRPTLRYKAVS